MTSHDPQIIHAHLGAVRVSVAAALEAGITPQMLRDIIDGQERGHAAAAATRNGLAGRAPITFSVAVPDSQTPCDDCGSLSEIQLGALVLRHRVDCERATVHYRHLTDVHLILNQVYDHIRVIRDSYDAATRTWSPQALIRMFSAAETSAALAEVMTEDAHTVADRLLPGGEYAAARAAAMVASQYLGEAKGLVRSLRIIVDARSEVIAS